MNGDTRMRTLDSLSGNCKTSGQQEEMAEVEVPCSQVTPQDMDCPTYYRWLKSCLGKTHHAERNKTTSERSEHNSKAKRKRFRPKHSSRPHRRAVSKQ